MLVPKTSPTAGVDAIYIRLIDGNSFTGYAKPIIEKIPYGGGLATMADAVSDHYEAKAQLKTKLYPTQALLLLGWLMTRINAGQTTPWVTTEPPYDLASCTVYHAVRNSDGSYRRKAYKGVKCAGGTIEVSRQSTTAMLTLDLVACQCQGNQFDSTLDPGLTAFPLPVETDYPTGPYTFKSTAGGLTIGSVRVGYDTLSLRIQNALDGRWFETSYLQINQFCGRQTSLSTQLYLKATPDDRVTYEAITTATAASLVFASAVGSQTCTITLNGKNVIDDLPYNLPLDSAYMLNMELGNLWDPSGASGAGADISFAMT